MMTIVPKVVRNQIHVDDAIATLSALEFTQAEQAIVLGYMRQRVHIVSEIRAELEKMFPHNANEARALITEGEFPQLGMTTLKAAMLSGELLALSQVLTAIRQMD
jgi:hypothetical protein